MSANESFCSQSESLTPPSIVEMAITKSRRVLSEKSKELTVSFSQLVHYARMQIITSLGNKNRTTKLLNNIT